MIASSVSSIVKELIDAGIMPKLCRRFTMEIVPGAPIMLKSEVYVTEEHFRAIADALLESGPSDIASEVKAFSMEREKESAGIIVNDASILGEEYARFHLQKAR